MSSLRRKLAGLIAVVIAIAAPALILVGSASAAPVCDRSWAAPIDGDWGNGLMWNPPGVPVASDDVCIQVSGSYKVTLTGQRNVVSVQVGGAAGTQELVIEGRVPSNAAYLLPSSEAIIGPNGVVTLTSFGGSSQAQFGQNSTVITNSGTINSILGAGGLRVPLGSVANNGDMNIDVYTESHSGGTLTNNGTVDYAAKTGTVTFSPGETWASFYVVVKGDHVYEGIGEIMWVDLNPALSTVAIKSGTAFGKIIDDDRPAKVSIDDSWVYEGNSGTRYMEFKISLDSTSTVPVTAHYSTFNETATAGSDYVAALNQSVTFAPGERYKVIKIVIKGDRHREAHEKFKVRLTSAVGAEIHDSTAYGVIKNDD